jgi:hypothetical protein
MTLHYSFVSQSALRQPLGASVYTVLGSDQRLVSMPIFVAKALETLKPEINEMIRAGTCILRFGSGKYTDMGSRVTGQISWNLWPCCFNRTRRFASHDLHRRVIVRYPGAPLPCPSPFPSMSKILHSSSPPHSKIPTGDPPSACTLCMHTLHAHSVFHPRSKNPHWGCTPCIPSVFHPQSPNPRPILNLHPLLITRPSPPP